MGYSLGVLNYNPSFGIGPAYLPLIGNIGVVAYALIVAYTITKHHLMDISIIISRAVAWVMTVVFLGSVYLGLVWLHLTYASPRIDWLFLTWTILYGILVGEAFHRIRLFIQTTSDKVFLRGKYDYYKELSDASSHVGETLSLPDILNVLCATFLEVVEISNPRLYLPEFFTEAEKSSNRYLAYDRETHLPDKNSREIRFDDALVTELRGKREPLHNVKELHAALVVPCLLEDRLIAIFVLGPKLSEDPYTDEDIRLLQVLASQAAVALDHTRSYEKIKIELEAATKHLERSQRLAAIGTLTAGVTHEIRNPLTVVRAETERLPKEPRDTSYLNEFKDLILKHIGRIEGVVQRMLNFAKDSPHEDKEADLNEQLNAVLSLIKFDGVQLKKELQPLPPLRCDPEELQQVFINIIQNAMDAMPHGGELRIKTHTREGKSAVEISDTGNGIPPEIQELIFDPFFSTRHEGVGLGLSIAYRIIRQHGGDVKVSSKVGKGTTFTILF